MLPINCRNLDNICCTCLVHIHQPEDTKQSAYDIKKETNLLNMLRLTAYRDVLKNPLNMKYVNDYCRKVCNTCFHNIKMAFGFRERIIASTKNLKGLLENDTKAKKLKYCCRICLNLQNVVGDNEDINKNYLKWMDSFSGMEKITNELVLILDRVLPKQLCQNCVEEIQNIEELQLSSKCSFEHIVSEISKNDNNAFEGHSRSLKDKTTEHKFLPPKCHNNKCKSIFDSNDIIVIKCEKEDPEYLDTIVCNNVNDIQNENRNIYGKNALIDKKYYSGMTLKAFYDDSIMSLKDKSNEKEFVSLQSEAKNESTYDTNDAIVLKCEEGDIQYQETEIYNKAKDQKSEKNNTNNTNTLVNKTDYAAIPLKASSDESAMDFERDDDNDSDFVITDVGKSTMTDSTGANDHTKIYEKDWMRMNMDQAALKMKRKRKPTNFWNEDTETKFLNVWRNHLSDLNGPKKHSLVYEEMAKDLSQYNIVITPLDVKYKISNMMKKFRQHKASCGSLSDWCHYATMTEMFGHKPAQDQDLSENLGFFDSKTINSPILLDSSSNHDTSSRTLFDSNTTNSVMTSVLKKRKKFYQRDKMIEKIVKSSKAQLDSLQKIAASLQSTSESVAQLVKSQREFNSAIIQFLNSR